MRLEWQAHIDEMLQQYKQIRDRLGDAQQQVAQLTATAESDDGMVSVTVDHRGELVSVTLHARTYRMLDPSALGETIVATAKQATQDVRDQAKAIMSPLLPPNIVGGEHGDPASGDGLLDMLPKDPRDLSRFQGSAP